VLAVLTVAPAAQLGSNLIEPLPAGEQRQEKTMRAAVKERILGPPAEAIKWAL
jgi:hypothetical protein